MNKENVLAKIKLSEDKTIKSVELVDLINEFRKLENGKTKLRHSDFMKKIRKEVKMLESLGLSGQGRISLAKYLDEQGKSRDCFELNCDGIKHIIDITKSTDRIPMQKVYEEIGGDYSQVTCIDRFENTFFNKLAETLIVLGYHVETQKSILDKYRLDGFIEKLNLVIEYDEAQHFIEPEKSKDRIRQIEIENKLKYKFVRLNYQDTDAHNIGLVIKAIIKESLI